MKHLRDNLTANTRNLIENVSKTYDNVKTKITSVFPGRHREKSERELLIDNIIEARSEMERAEHAFNELTDSAAIDYASYNIMAARARYVYLLGIAKKNNIKF